MPITTGYHSEQLDLRYEGKLFPVVITSINGSPTMYDSNNKEIDSLVIDKLFDDKDFKTSFQYSIKMMENDTARAAANLYLAMHVDRVV